MAGETPVLRLAVKMSVPCRAMNRVSVDRRGTGRFGASGAGVRLWSCALEKAGRSAGSVAGNGDQNHRRFRRRRGPWRLPCDTVSSGAADPANAPPGAGGIQFMLFGCDLGMVMRGPVWPGAGNGDPAGYRFRVGAATSCAVANKGDQQPQKDGRQRPRMSHDLPAHDLAAAPLVLLGFALVLRA